MKGSSISKETLIFLISLVVIVVVIYTLVISPKRNSANHFNGTDKPDSANSQGWLVITSLLVIGLVAFYFSFARAQRDTTRTRLPQNLNKYIRLRVTS